MIHKCLSDLDLYKGFGMQEREVYLKRNRTPLSHQERIVINSDEAYLNEKGSILERISDITPARIT